MERRGTSPDFARTIVRTRNSVIAALMVRRGEANGMLCGTIGQFQRHLRHLLNVLGKDPHVHEVAALNLLILSRGTFFIVDTHVTPEPSAEAIAEMTIMAAREVRRFGIEPKVALLSHSNFGSADTATAIRMREALALVQQRVPDLEVEGEMHGDSAVSEEIRSQIFPNARLKGSANLLVMPTLDAANIAFNLLKTLGDGLSVGPMLLGLAHPAHILTPSVTVRGIVNMTALCVVDAQEQASAGAGF
jgi:malate dehydrogenase (oxaloacetate-decarboxylating)(NADP+)